VCNAAGQILLRQKIEMEQKWLTTEIEHEGFPLYLRKPDYSDIFIYQDKFPRLLRVTQKLEKVKSNGLPEPDYNMSLIDFDGEMTDLFDRDNEGLIFLIETFGGERNYYYFISDSVDYENKIEELTNNNKDIELETHSHADNDWGFLKKYPTNLY
jgi:Family of unknown function (DUF695)